MLYIIYNQKRKNKSTKPKENFRLNIQFLTSKHKNENYQTWSTVRQEEDSEGEYSEEKKSHSERETNVLLVFFLLLTQNGHF